MVHFFKHITSKVEEKPNSSFFSGPSKYLLISLGAILVYQAIWAQLLLPLMFIESLLLLFAALQIARESICRPPLCVVVWS